MQTKFRTTDTGYGQQTMEGIHLRNLTPGKEDIAQAMKANPDFAPAPANAPFDLSSCCPANEDGEENVCTSYMEFVNTLLTRAGECICGLIEYVKSLLCPVALTAEETHVSAFVNKWAKRPIASQKDAAEMEADFDTFRPRSINDYRTLTAAQWVRRDVAERHMDLVYLERLEMESPYTWWDEAVTKLICKYPSNAQVKALVIESLTTWLDTPADQRGVGQVVTDEQVVVQFTKFWSDGEKNVALWKRSYESLPDAVKEKARSAFLAAHADLRGQIPADAWPTMCTPEQAQDRVERRKREQVAVKDKLICEHVVDPAVMKAVNEWKPEAE